MIDAFSLFIINGQGDSKQIHLLELAEGSKISVGYYYGTAFGESSNVDLKELLELWHSTQKVGK